MVQGIATSIDALSVGFTIAGYDLKMAISSCLIIGAVTFAICMAGLAIGKKAGMKLAGKAGFRNADRKGFLFGACSYILEIRKSEARHDS